MGEGVLYPAITTVVSDETLANASPWTLGGATVAAAIPIGIGIFAGGEFVIGIGTFGAGGGLMAMPAPFMGEVMTAGGSVPITVGRFLSEGTCFVIASPYIAYIEVWPRITANPGLVLVPVAGIVDLIDPGIPKTGIGVGGRAIGWILEQLGIDLWPLTS